MNFLLGAWYTPWTWGDDFINNVLSLINWIFIMIDSMVYSFVSYVYQIFLALAQGGSLFDNTFVEELVGRIYIILGVVMLFLIAYSLLKVMINPDELTKGKNSPVNIIKDVLISIGLIALLPTIFDFAFDFQNSLLANNTIGKIIVGNKGSLSGDGTEDSAAIIRKGGYVMASGVWQAFMHANEGYCSTKSEEGGSCEVVHVDEEKTKTFGDLWDEAEKATTFWKFTQAIPAIVDGKVTYYFIVSTVAGVFVLFVLFSYCIDMALRLVKLAVFEVIAPIPILARIIPNEQAKKVFSNWLKATISTFVEVFIRIALLFFAVLLISTVIASVDNFFGALFSGSARVDILFFAQALIILGVIMFVKQAPAIIKEITGLDGSKYNVLNSAKQGLSFLAGGIAGGSAVSAFRAWDQAGQAKKLTDMSAIGNQFKRREANKEARDLQKAAGMSGRQRLAMNTANGFRRAFGFDDLKGQADKNFEHNRDMEGNQFTANNDTGTGIRIGTDAHGNPIYLQVRDLHGSMIDLDEHATDILLNDENINAMNDVKARNAIAKSQIAEQIRRYDDINKSNAEVATLIKAMEDKAKSEMGKGKYNLKDDSGNDLVFSYVDKHGHSGSWGAGGHTQEEYEKWLEAMQDRLEADEYAKLAQQLKDSKNVYTVEHFIENSGDSEIATLKTKLFDRVNTQHILNHDGTERRTTEVSTITSKASGLDITYQEAKALKKDIEENVKQVVDQAVYRENMSKSQLDTQDSAIDRIIGQGKEQVEVQKTSSEYKAYEASSKAQQTRQNGGSGGSGH